LEEMSKVIFVLRRRRDMSRDECLRHWSGEQHTAIVSSIPGLRKWVQNHVVSAAGEPICDGVGELWFDSSETMQHALQSAEMGAAVEDAGRFLDMDRTGMVIVNERMPTS
jgi:uncharacterized protein (TIGR02118 family)